MLWKIVLSGLFLILSFPNFNLSYLAFIGFIPLFFAVENKSPQKAFLIFFITGFIFYLGTLYWLYHVTVIGLIILCLYLALYFGLFGLFTLHITHYTLHKHIVFRLFFISLAWVILEYIQANIPIMGFGWALLGYSQYKNLLLIQIADFSGVYGVSFVVMMVNVGIYMSLRVRLGRRSNLRLAITILVLIATCAYGFFRLNERQGTSSLRVSVIQGNISQELKWDPDAQDMIIEKYISLTKMSALDNPDLMVWPETSFPGFFETDKEMTDEVLNLAKEIKIPILLGANTEKYDKYFNSAVLISSEGKIAGKYDKTHLVPFGEYVPFSNKFPALHKLVLGELGEFTPGKEFRAFSFQPSAFSTSVKFSVLICFEDIFPEISRKFVQNGAKFLVVVTNDAWYGKSGAPYQHAACSVFRAIENRIPIVRCANTGYSCFIDSRGRIYGSVGEKKSLLFVTGYKTSYIKIEP
ncbi:MAG: apolipoprotein N-acyltransferase [Candidatus Omnitrophota bacterium]|nr:apolipoprotein N-acyltransferase [Candidatus Omnitrophota bacterium]